MNNIKKLEGQYIVVSEIVITGALTKGSQIMALDALDLTIRTHQETLQTFADAPIFGAQNAKQFKFGDFCVEVALISMPDKIKAIINVEFDRCE